MFVNIWQITKWQISIEHIIYSPFLDADREAGLSSSEIGTFFDVIVSEGLLTRKNK